jgi:hypothetical protein
LCTALWSGKNYWIFDLFKNINMNCKAKIVKTYKPLPLLVKAVMFRQQTAE